MDLFLTLLDISLAVMFTLLILAVLLGFIGSILKPELDIRPFKINPLIHFFTASLVLLCFYLYFVTSFKYSLFSFIVFLILTILVEEFYNFRATKR